MNECRADLRENPATLAWPWGPGVVTPLPDFKERTGVVAAVVGVNPTFVGAALLQGVRVVPVEGATGTVDEPAAREVRRGASRRSRSTTSSSSTWTPRRRRRTRATSSRRSAALERIDAHVLAPALREIESRGDARILVVGGEAVAVDSGRHLLDPVPFAMFGPGVRSHRGAAFSEVAAREGGLPGRARARTARLRAADGLSAPTYENGRPSRRTAARRETCARD